jgi:hypothetical protein
VRAVRRRIGVSERHAVRVAEINWTRIVGPGGSASGHGRTTQPHELRAAIAESVAEHLKAYDVAKFCEDIGLAPEAPGEDAFRSKRTYVHSKIAGKPATELARIARRILEEWDDQHLLSMVDALGARGVRGEVRNLIFASNGPKPKIILRDAINNVIEVVENEQFCLYSDRPLGEGGLSWADLADWWADTLQTSNTDVAARHLWRPLRESLDSEPEVLLFSAYTRRYQSGFGQPAPVPQVYLHYDPYTAANGRRSALVRQRMDSYFYCLNDDAS